MEDQTKRNKDLSIHHSVALVSPYELLVLTLVSLKLLEMLPLFELSPQIRRALLYTDGNVVALIEAIG